MSEPESFCETLRHSLWKYQKWVCLSITILALTGAILAIFVTKSTSTFPCVSYGSSSLANSVSISCLQYIWTKSGCTAVKGGIYPPLDYSGWWNRSPQGSSTVSCPNHNDSPTCGAGSYSTIITYMQLCNPSFTGP